MVVKFLFGIVALIAIICDVRMYVRVNYTRP